MVELHPRMDRGDRGVPGVELLVPQHHPRSARARQKDRASAIVSVREQRIGVEVQLLDAAEIDLLAGVMDDVFVFR